MSAIEVMQQIEALPEKEQHDVFVFLAKKVLAGQAGKATPWLGKSLSFDEACDVVFRENRKLLSALAK